jgi:TatD DNase family protein
MIIDSHVHYSLRSYDAEALPYLDYANDTLTLTRGDRAALLQTMKARGIALCIEPSTGFDRIEAQLALASEYHPYIRLALGVHPKRCASTPWSSRKQLRCYVLENDVVAIGETGLDYHLPPAQCHRLRQKMWFCYQLRLAHERKLPLILHVREADDDALRILTRYRRLLHGGVAHCFGGNTRCAQAYIDLGFAIGIGARLLQENDGGELLRQTVREIPLHAMLAETDAPYVLPPLPALFCSASQRKKLRNSSLILPAVIERIALLKGERTATVEQALYENTLRVFHLHA